MQLMIYLARAPEKIVDLGRIMTWAENTISTQERKDTVA